jgi:hypothetical protein
MEQLVTIENIKVLFPNEWVLLGNPVFDERHLDVLSGIPIYHSEDKKEVCYKGRDMTDGYSKITLIYTGSFKPRRKITGIFRVY